jgi:type II secretory pathway pseudopilin PulG
MPHQQSATWRSDRGERGFALLALLAALTIAMIVMTAALPAIKHDAQREKEEEFFWRGAQIAGAIQKYASLRGGQINAYPAKLEDLAARIQVQGKRLRVLRPSALRDPMTEKGDWKEVRVGDPVLQSFLGFYVAAMPKKQPPLPPPPTDLVQFAMLAQNSNAPGTDPNKEQSSLGFNTQLHSESGPLIGVVSKSKEHLIREYLGIPTYDECLFFPGVRMVVAGLPMLVLAQSQPQNQTPQKDTRCPNGGVWFEAGQNGVSKSGCYGGLGGGICPPSDPKCRGDVPPPPPAPPRPFDPVAR